MKKTLIEVTLGLVYLGVSLALIRYMKCDPAYLALTFSCLALSENLINHK